jgi:hypothetical protein
MKDVGAVECKDFLTAGGVCWWLAHVISSFRLYPTIIHSPNKAAGVQVGFGCQDKDFQSKSDLYLTSLK